MASSQRNMPPLAAAATECRFSGQGIVEREIEPIKFDSPCSVRLHGDLVIIYKLREVGGSKIPRFIQEGAPQEFDQLFLLHDPETFFRSYSACRDTIHQMIAQTWPLLGEFDLAADNWEDFQPHDLATMIVNRYRHDVDDHMGVGLRYDVDLALTIWATAVYSEPKALLLSCKAAAAATECPSSAVPATASGKCSVCMDDLAAAEDTVALPCAHAFHDRCLGPWFRRVSTCPMCCRDMSVYLAAVTPKGKLPGLEA